MKAIKFSRLILALCASFALFFVACEQGGVGDTIEDAGDETGDAVEDAGDAVEDAVN